MTTTYDSSNPDALRKVNAQSNYHLHIDPTTLTDEEWAEKSAQLADIRKRENGGI